MLNEKNYYYQIDLIEKKNVNWLTIFQWIQVDKLEKKYEKSF